MLEMAGSKPNTYPKLDGESLLPLLTSKGSLKRKEIFLYRSYEDQYAYIRKDDWKMIIYRSGKTELFNLKEDLAEEHALSEQYPEKVKEFQKKLEAWEKEMGVWKIGK